MSICADPSAYGLSYEVYKIRTVWDGLLLRGQLGGNRVLHDRIRVQLGEAAEILLVIYLDENSQREGLKLMG